MEPLNQFFLTTISIFHKTLREQIKKFLKKKSLLTFFGCSTRWNSLKCIFDSRLTFELCEPYKNKFYYVSFNVNF